jgi:hypothetical protein
VALFVGSKRPCKKCRDSDIAASPEQEDPQSPEDETT